MNKNKPIIYGIKTVDNKLHYIGKTIKKSKTENKLCRSDAARHKNTINSIFKNNENVEVVEIKQTDDGVWFDDKLLEVVKAHKEDNPLLNAQWMLDGKRGIWDGTDGYWKGKKRDSHTLQKLSESKFRKIVQYDKEGKYVKTWNSAKQVAIEVFGDYRIVNGGGCTKFYRILSSEKISTRFKFDSYWFRESEFKKHFNIIPSKINISVILEKEKQKKKENSKQIVRTTLRRYTIKQYDLESNVVKIYENAFEAGYFLKLPHNTINRICRGYITDPYIILKYGEKTRQPIEMKYPEYVVLPRSAHYPADFSFVNIKVSRPKSKKEIKQYVKTRTRSTIEQYIGNILIKTFEDVSDAAKHLKMKECTIWNMVYRNDGKKTLDLRLGPKKQILLSDFLFKKENIKDTENIKNTKVKRTKELCQIEALKYKTRGDFKKHDQATWRYSHRHGWFDEICSHMPKNVFKNN